MQVKIRNSLILGIVWLVMTAGLFYWQFMQRKELEELENITNELAHLPGLIEKVNALSDKHKGVKREYDSRKKEIPLHEGMEQTYAFIINGLDQAGKMKVGIEVAGTQTLGDWGYSKYLLRQGEGQFNNIYRFIHYLENGKNLQKIHGLRLTQEERLNDQTGLVAKTISFQMELHACFSKFPELSTSSSAKALLVPSPPFNPFSPKFATVVQREILPSEVIPELAELKATFVGSALVLYRNSFVVVKIGDKVRGGYVVSAIDPTLGKVEFTLNEGGIVRRIEKKIQFEK